MGSSASFENLYTFFIAILAYSYSSCSSKAFTFSRDLKSLGSIVASNRSKSSISSKPPTLSAPVAACYLVRSTSSREGSLLLLSNYFSSSSSSSSFSKSAWRSALRFAAISWALKIEDDLRRMRRSLSAIKAFCLRLSFASYSSSSRSAPNS